MKQKFYVQGLDNNVKCFTKTRKTFQEAKLIALGPMGKLPLRSIRTVHSFEIVGVHLHGLRTVKDKYKNPCTNND